MNDTVWVKNKDKIWGGRVMQITYSNSEEDSGKFKTKWIDSRG